MNSSIRFILIALIATSLVVGFDVYAALEDGLISAWTFDDGTARDHGGGGNDGEFINGASTSPGLVGMGLNLDNPTNPNVGEDTGQYVRIPSSASLEQEDGVFSVSLWVNVRPGGGRDHAAMFWKGEGVGWGPLFMVRMCTTSDVNMTWGSCSDGVEGWFATDGVYTEGEWTHVAYVADGSAATAYVNSVVPPSGQNNPRELTAPLLTFPNEPVEIGVGRRVGGNDGQDSWLDAMIDEVYFWDRALGADEVAELAGGTVPTAVESKGKLSTTWANIKTGR